MKSLRNARLDEMENMVLNKGTVSLKELSQAFQISINTVRNDVENLLQRGRLRKVYGGVASLATDQTLVEYVIREDKSTGLKRELCKKAASLVDDGDSIYLDSGTTTIHMVEYLKHKKNLKVVTNNIVVISMLLSCDDIQVLGIGGKVNNKTKSFASPESLAMLEYYNIQKAFMAATAVNIRNGAMNSAFDERSIKQKIVEKAEQVYLLADSTKFGKNALLTYCTLEELDAIVTDSAPGEYKALFEEKGIRLI